MSLWFSDTTARQYKTRHQALERMRLFSILFAPSGLPEIAIVGSVVAKNPGVVFAESNVITGFPVELIDRLAAFSGPRKLGGNEAQIKRYKENGEIRKRKKEYQKILKIPITTPPPILAMPSTPLPAPPHPLRPSCPYQEILEEQEREVEQGEYFFFVLMKTKFVFLFSFRSFLPLLSESLKK